jgi:hypothetical protein
MTKKRSKKELWNENLAKKRKKTQQIELVGTQYPTPVSWLYLEET